MPSRVLSRTALAGAWIDARLSRRSTVLGLLGAIGVAYLAVVQLLGVAAFSPDSWSYFELAKTVFSGDFYRFNTFRSHFSEHYSASFPFGFPIALAVLHGVVGPVPEAAQYFNVAVMLATAYVVVRIGDELRFPAVAGLAVACSLMLYLPYFDEVRAGRSLPLAIMLFAVACLLHLRDRPGAAGLLFGLSALVRFDFLTHAIVFIAVAPLLRRRFDPGAFPLAAAGFAIGIAPWVVYGFVHFGTFWASDNAWVAMSALPAFVEDYPAAAAITASQDVALWLGRLAANVRPLGEALQWASTQFPLVPVLAVAILLDWRVASGHGIARFAICAAALAASTVPYVLTGYVDPRYFSVHLVCASLLLWSYLLPSNRGRRTGALVQWTGVVAVGLVVALGARDLYRSAIYGQGQADEMRKELALIESLRQCHLRTPAVTYLFAGERLSPFKYGAITGMRTARLPTNFVAMDEPQRKAFFARMSPFVLVKTFSDDRQCPT